MASWKKILVEGDAVTSNLATANLSATSSVRTFSLADGASLFAFKDDDANDLFSIVVTADNAATTSLSGGMQIIEDGASPANQGCLKLFESSAASNYVCLMANGSATADQTITFPAAGPTGANQILESDASGNLSWINTPSGSGGGVVATYTNGTDNRVITSSGSDSINGEANLTFNGSQLTVTGRCTISDFTTLTTNNRGLKGTTTGSSVVDLIKCNTSDSVEVGTSSTKTVLSGNIIDAGSLELVCGKLNAESINVEPQGSSNGAIGKGAEVLAVASSQSVTAGSAYYLNNTSTWSGADKDQEAAAAGFLVIATGSNATNGMLIRGIVRPNNLQGSPSVGDKVYLGDNGTLTSDISGFSDGDFVRVVGHYIATNSIYFNPSQEYIELA